MPFDHQKAQGVIDFFEKRLRHSIGRHAGHPFILAPWEKRILLDVFGTVTEEGLRRFHTMFLSTAKKNGKTALAAGLALQGLSADREGEPHIYSAASVRDQAALAFNAARSMVARSAALRARCLVRPGIKRIIFEPNEGFYTAISADAGSWDGIQPSRFIADEIHRWGSNTDLWDILDKGTSLRQQPLGIAISTAGVFGESELCWQFSETTRQVNEGVISLPQFYGRIFSTPAEWDWREPGEPAVYDKWNEIVRPATGWYAANPSLGQFLPLERLIEERDEAQHSPAKQRAFERFRLNRWVQHEQRWINLKDWDACRGDVDPDALRGQTCYAGLDLATRKDFASLVLVFPQENGKYKLLPFFWLPKEYDVSQAMLDRIRPWIKDGLIEATEGPVIDFSVIRRRINEFGQKYLIKAIAFDPWNANSLIQDIAADGFVVVEVRQTFAKMSEPSKQFEAFILEKRLEHDGNRTLRWNVDSCAIQVDNHDNILPSKPNREKSLKRVDGVLASIMGLEAAVRLQAAEIAGRSVYECEETCVM